MKQTVMQNSGT